MGGHLRVSCAALLLLAGSGCGQGEPKNADASADAASRAARPPNVVLFLADDLGWADHSLGPGAFYETPHLERLAGEGVTFTAAWAAPVCRPSRAGLLTGRYPGARLKIVGGPRSRSPGVPERDDPRHRMVRPERMPILRPEEVTLAEVLRDAGYATGFFGKWDLGSVRSGPEGQGFETSFPVGDRSVKSHIAPYGAFQLMQARPGEYLTDRLTSEAIQWLGQQAGRRPFFLYLAHHAVHFPWQGKPALVAKYRAKAARLGPDAPQRNPVMAAMVESLDESLGRILEALEARGVADETLVIFLSDNGGVTDDFEGAPITSNHPLRGAKGTTLEGGLRVPLVVRWPGVAQGGTRVDTPVSHVDIFPTVVAAAGLAPPAGRVIDGRDLRPLLADAGAFPDRAVFSHFPLHEFSSAVRQGRWKLIRYYGAGPGGAPRDVLYDLDADPGESRDLSSAETRRAHQLAGLLDDWLADTGALLPIPNPAHRAPRPAAEGAVAQPR